MPMNELNENVLREEASAALTIAEEGRSILNERDFVNAGNFLKVIKERKDRIVAYWKPKKEQAQALHKSLVAAEKELLEPLEKADAIIRRGMLDYQKEQDRIREEAERERRRLEEEAARKAEEARRLVEEANRKEELDEDDVSILLLAEAESQAAVAQVVPPPPPPAKVAGISKTTIWKARVVDDKVVPVSVMGIMIRPIDQTALNKLAMLSKGESQIPGVEFYPDDRLNVRY